MSQTTISYQLVYITADGKQETTDKIKMWITEFGGNIAKDEAWGKKQFSYPIKKHSSGYYHLLSFKMSPSTVRQLTKKIDFDTEIIRYLLVK